MKKWLWGSLFLSFFAFQSVFATSLVGGWQDVNSWDTEFLEQKINKCKADWGTIDTNFKFINGKIVNTYFCQLDADNVCDLDSYYAGECFFYLKKEVNPIKEEIVDYWKYKALIEEYRKILYSLPQFKFTTIESWGKWIYAEKNLAEAVMIMQNVNTRIDKIVKEKPTKKEVFYTVRDENLRIINNLAQQFVVDDIADLSPIKAILWGVMKVTEITKLDNLYYEVKATDKHVNSIFKTKFKVEKNEKLQTVLDIQITSKQEEL